VARVLVGVTGGIAAYKACELVRLLVKDGHEVTPILTSDAERFVAAHTFEALARREAARDLYPHLVDADLLVIAPLSANTLAKLAHGLADNVLTQAALAVRAPVLVAPAVNVRMWEHPATQDNVRLLVERGVHLIGPEEGELAEGEHGVGRMSEPEAIFARCLALLGADGPLRGKQVVVSAGGTREPLDSVRFVGNRSSGKMGVAVAREARRRGADVTLVASNLAVSTPEGLEVVQAPSAADLAREVLARAGADVVVMAAAVADYRPADPAGRKRPKGSETWTVDLEPTEDVLAELGRRRQNGQILVGFAADEGDDGLARARAKLTNKGGNLFVYNDVSRSDIGFESDWNELVLLTPGGEMMVSRRSKDECAVAILDQVEALLRGV
jgi:phosphopantothenoylcysteine decarboxylase / phosphopantothenate---cysteine ligase